jgi:ketosteroid isomerase-like protein
MDETARELIERLFDAFNRRDQAGIVAVCDAGMEFHAVTAEEVGRTDPYVGPEGLRDYLADVAQVWEELLITAKEVESKGECLMVRGRVYLRSRDLGIRDLPTCWIWEVRDGRFVSGRAFVDQRLAEEYFAAR